MRLFYSSQIQSNTTYKQKKYIGYRARLKENKSFLGIFYGDAVGGSLAGYFLVYFYEVIRTHMVMDILRDYLYDDIFAALSLYMVINAYTPAK